MEVVLHNIGWVNKDRNVETIDTGRGPNFDEGGSESCGSQMWR